MLLLFLLTVVNQNWINIYVLELFIYTNNDITAIDYNIYEITHKPTLYPKV